MKIDKETLKRQIEEDPDLPVEAGVPHCEMEESMSREDEIRARETWVGYSACNIPTSFVTITSEERAYLLDQLAERDAEIARLREALKNSARYMDGCEREIARKDAALRRITQLADLSECTANELEDAAAACLGLCYGIARAALASTGGNDA